MIIAMLAILCQAALVLIVVGIIYKIVWTIFDVIRLYAYYRCGKGNIFTTEEKISLGITEPKDYDPEPVVFEPDKL